MSLDSQTDTLLRISTSKRPRGTSCTVDIDRYVPLRFRTYREPLGVGYVRLGNYSTTLLELAVEPRTQLVRGITVVSFERASPWPEFEVDDAGEGLPAVSTSFEGGERIDLHREFAVAVRPCEVIVFWGTLVGCYAYRHGDARFLGTEGALVGVWFTGLTEEQSRLFGSHAGVV